MKNQSFTQRLTSLTWVQNILMAEWVFPSPASIMPAYFALLIGFITASVVSVSVGYIIAPHTTVATKSAPTNAMANKKSKRLENENVSPDLPKLNAIDLNLPSYPMLVEFNNIAGRNIFNSEGALKDEQDNKELHCEAVPSEMPLKFTGVIYGGTNQSSLVVLESSATKSSEVFLFGDTVPGDAQIISIEKDRLVLQRSKSCPEFLLLEPPPVLKRRVASTKGKRIETKVSDDFGGDGFREEGFERKGNRTQVDTRWVEKALGLDFAKTLQDAKANPNMIGKDVKGFILTKIRPNSVYEKMGLIDGDIIETINGIELNGMAQAVQTLNTLRSELRSGSAITLSIQRAGKSMQMSLNIR